MSWHGMPRVRLVMMSFFKQSQESDLTADRDENEDCDKYVTAFPHEHHWH